MLAVADGTVFSVGWNKIGGWRLWLRDRAGNEFYYAHLSAYSPLALNERAGARRHVLGFVGNTGDAEGTPYHLHFEIHPVQLLGLGYDGVVNPTPYLDAWQRLQDVRFSSAGALLPGARAADVDARARAGRDPASDLATSRARAGSIPARCGARSRRPPRDAAPADG